MSKRNPLHSSALSEWWTPQPFILAARRTMGGIDLDPASCAEANRVVGATRFYSVEDNGLHQPWAGRIFLNPPGGQVAQFWQRLIAHWIPRLIEQAIWIGYSLEQLQTLQTIGAEAIPTDFPLCVPRKRIQFIRPDGQLATNPTHANFIAYIGPHISRFVTEFSDFGGIS